MSETIFDLIVAKKIKSYPIWEDDKYLAFLTPYPNTPGFSVLIPKQNPGDYFFDLEDNLIYELINRAKIVAGLLKKALKVSRVALVIEGTGVAYCHLKLIPLHGELGKQTNIWSNHQEFYPKYVGYLTTTEGPKMDDNELLQIQHKILKESKKI
ncbi:MAG: HIT family protein [Patescibacteria group bacterium]|nr:HIT family protein [Patescibacteria group bacterium]